MEGICGGCFPLKWYRHLENVLTKKFFLTREQYSKINELFVCGSWISAKDAVDEV